MKTVPADAVKLASSRGSRSLGETRSCCTSSNLISLSTTEKSEGHLCITVTLACENASESAVTVQRGRCQSKSKFLGSAAEARVRYRHCLVENKRHNLAHTSATSVVRKEMECLRIGANEMCWLMEGVEEGGKLQDLQ
jgi:hypothetical protein